MKIRFSTFILFITLAVGATIRLMSGPIKDLFISGQLHRYLWPAVLLFGAGYITRWVGDLFYKKPASTPSSDEEDEGDSE